MFITRILMIIFLLPALNVSAGNAAVYAEKQTEGFTETTFKVYGNCGMCKKRIETAVLELEGVESADWDIASKILTLAYNEAIIKVDEIHKTIAAVGHDTEKEKATSKVYNALHGCCQYERAE